MAERLKDSDKMPIGKFKGRPMEKVPAWHLDWLSEQPWIGDYPKLRAYIDYNRAVIDKELEDPKAYGVEDWPE